MPAWLVWVIVATVLGGVEMLSLTLVAGLLGVAAVAAAATAALGVGGTGQAAAFCGHQWCIDRHPAPGAAPAPPKLDQPPAERGDGNHTWLIPSELTRALDAFASGFGDRRTEQTSTPGPAASGEAAGPPQIPPVVIPARPAADGAAGPRSIRGEQAPGTQHHEQDDARRTG